MAYILQKGHDYCCLDGRNKVHKTQDIDFATRFMDIRKAYDFLYMASRKLKGGESGWRHGDGWKGFHKAEGVL